ncbi:prepilin-type N-terminal cleavage/methylation domain-containing protein [Candidatus Omnitrophota bacterium]
MKSRLPFLKRFLRARRAFTLPELLLAMAILAFALCSILLGFITCFTLNEINRNTTSATSHAQYKMEQLKDTPFLSIVNDTINATDGDWPSVLDALPTEALTVTVTEVGGTNGTLLDINVTASWQDRGLRQRNITLQTYIAED